MSKVILLILTFCGLSFRLEILPLTLINGSKNKLCKLSCFVVTFLVKNLFSVNPLKLESDG